MFKMLLLILIATTITTTILTIVHKLNGNSENVLDCYKSQYEELLYNSDSRCEVWSPYSSFESVHDAENAMKMRVLDMPQFTFERWLTLYNNKPEAWVIEKKEYKHFANIPYYQKTTVHTDKRGHEKESTTYLPIFWTSAAELQKYREWVEKEYQYGKAAEFERNREKNMKQLVGYIQEDLQRLHDAIQTAPLTTEKKNIVLKLSDGTEVEVPPTDKISAYPVQVICDAKARAK